MQKLFFKVYIEYNSTTKSWRKALGRDLHKNGHYISNSHLLKIEGRAMWLYAWFNQYADWHILKTRFRILCFPCRKLYTKGQCLQHASLWCLISCSIYFDDLYNLNQVLKDSHGHNNHQLNLGNLWWRYLFFFENSKVLDICWIQYGASL